MHNAQLLYYIQTQTQAGVSQKEIITILLQNGWTSDQIFEAFQQIKLHSQQPIAPKPALRLDSAQSVAQPVDKAESTLVVTNSEPELTPSQETKMGTTPAESEIPALETKSPTKVASDLVPVQPASLNVLETSAPTESIHSDEQVLEPNFVLTNPTSAEQALVETTPVLEAKPANQKKKPNTKLWLLLFVGTLCLGLLGVAGYFGYQYLNPEMNTVLARAYDVNSNVSSIEYAGDLTISGSLKQNAELNELIGSSEDLKGSLNVKMDGGLDLKDSANPKAYYNFATTSKDSNQNNLQINANTRLLKQKLHFILTTLPQDFKEIQNQWYYADLPKESEQLIQESPQYVLNTTNNPKLTPDQLRELQNQYVNIFSVMDTLPAQTINNQNTFHYRFSLNNQEVVNYILLTDKYLYNSSINESDRKELNSLAKDFESLSGEVWIGRNDYLIQKVNFNTRYNNSDIGKVDLSLDLFFKNHNQPLTLTEPTNSKPLEEAIETFSTPRVDENLDSDSDELPDWKEEFYGTDKNNPDTDGDGYKDGIEVRNGYDPLSTGRLELDAVEN